MWMTLIVKLAKNPTTWFIIAIVAILSYYNVVVWDLERTIEKQEIELSKVKQALSTTQRNFEITTDVNGKNSVVIEKCLADTDKLNTAYSNIVDDKNVLILKLRQEILKFKEPIVYPDTLTFKECTFKIRTKEHNAESNNTFNSLLNIGR